MIVELVAHTVITGWGAMRNAGWVDHVEDEGVWPDSERDADYLAEFGGRLCYQSWNRPNPATATNTGYLANIIQQEHFSVMEHASATFYLAEVSRSLTHELVRHRHLSFSQVSQRYVDESQAKMIMPPAIASEKVSQINRASVSMVAHDARFTYRMLIDRLATAGLSHKEARQAARAVLPNMTETKILVTGNMTAWRDVIRKRTKLNSKGEPLADREIHAVMVEILRQLREIAPNTFQDM